MDSATIRVIADLARKRAQAHEKYDKGDGLIRLGTIRALRQLAKDLDVSADAVAPRGRRMR